MTIDKMFDELENKVRDTYIVTLKYKYEFEEKYTVENQILVYDSLYDCYVWQNDWNEGYTDIEVLGYMLLGDVDTTKLESCEDCISREAVIRLVEQHPNIIGNRYSGLITNIKHLPSVTPQPKTGHWITTRTFMHDGEFYCDKCKCDSPNNEKWDYCPNCGAKMEVE